MNYKTKVQKTEAYFEKLNQGFTTDSIELQLQKEGFDKFQIKKIRNAAQKKFETQYVDKIKIYLLNEELEEHIDEFDDLDEKQFEEYQHAAHLKIILEGNRKVDLLYQKGTPIEEIAEKVMNPYYGIDEMTAQIEHHDYYNKPNKNQEAYLLGGLVLLVIGFCLRFLNIIPIRPIFLFSGLIALGAYYIGRSQLTQARIDDEKKDPYKY